MQFHYNSEMVDDAINHGNQVEFFRTVITVIGMAIGKGIRVEKKEFGIKERNQEFSCSLLGFREDSLGRGKIADFTCFSGASSFMLEVAHIGRGYEDRIKEFADWAIEHHGFGVPVRAESDA